MEKIGYLAPEGLVEPLRLELGKSGLEEYGRLFLVPKRSHPVYWAQNIWFEPKRMQVESVSDAAKKLKAIQRNWALYSFANHRRAELIREKLPHVSAKPLRFPGELPKGTLGAWTLLAPDEILYSCRTSSPFPNGVPRFEEDKSGPPSRAYLKLWEAFTLIEDCPGRGDRCLDVGACPGGWTWVLTKLGASVVAVDRSPLSSALMKHRLVEFRKGNAFSLNPKDGEKFSWIFSDLACYPEKLFDWVKAWLEVHPKTRFLCTLKFQGTSHYQVAERFAAIPGSRLIHLAANKHELTWVRNKPAP